MPKINPLTNDHLDSMQAVINTTPEVLEFLSACQQCGLDASDRVDTVNAQCEFCKKVIQNFFPEHSA